jgi:hypothetical protein
MDGEVVDTPKNGQAGATLRLWTDHDDAGVGIALR